MKRSKEVIAVILSLAMCLTLLVACGGGGSGGGETAAPEATGEISEALTPPPGAKLAEHIDVIMNETQLTVVNPMSPAGTGGPASWTFNMVYDALLEQIKPGEYGPRLAKEWHTDDYKTFTFKLRDDVIFHNGDPFTAEDVVFTIELAKATPSSPTFAQWNRVETVKAIDDYTVEIVLKEVYGDFYASISGFSMGILCRGEYTGKADDTTWTLVGTGPYKVVDFASNDYLKMERFEDYWGEKPPTKSLTFWTIPEMATRLVKMENKEAQVCFQMTPEDLDVVKSNPDYQIFPVLINEPVAIGFNDQGDPIVKDINFRKAIAHALNYDEIAMVALGDWAKAPWDGTLWGPDTQYRLEGLPKWEQDLNLAKEYLEKSVYNGETIELITSSAHNIRAAEIIQKQLEAVGIKINVETTDHAGLVEALKYDPNSKAQMHLFSLAMQKILGNTLSAHTTKVNNRLNYADPFLYERQAVYNATLDEEGRKKISYEIQQYWYETLPAIAVFYRVQAITAVKGIGGLKLSSNQFEHNMRGIYWDLNQTPKHLIP